MHFKRKSTPWLVAVGLVALPFAWADATRAAMVGSADVVVLMDESGSMAGEQAWIGGAVGMLDASLQAAGVGAGTVGNRYALVGYGSSAQPTGVAVGPAGKGPAVWMSASSFVSAADYLVLNGDKEDGYSAIDFFFDGYLPRSGSALNLILVTDEDRDRVDGSLTKQGIDELMSVTGAMLNVVVNASFKGDRDGVLVTALGLDANGYGYVADGEGGYERVAASASMSGSGSTVADYVDLAFSTGGAAWDLTQLRAGGPTASAFTDAFVDIKTEEIVAQVPAPSPLFLVSLGLLGLGWTKRLTG